MNTAHKNRVRGIAAVATALILTSPVQAQRCMPPTDWVGCSNTDFTNSFMNSTDNAATIEYDNWVSAFHSSSIRNSDGTFMIWGENMDSLGTSPLLTPQPINTTTYPKLTGTVLKVAMGGFEQAIILTTDGLFSVGRNGSGYCILPSPIVPRAFTKINATTTGNITNGTIGTGLPSGVTPADVKMMFASTNTLALTTCDGAVWVIAQNIQMRGNGSSAPSNSSWYRVKKDATNFLTDIVAVRGNGSSLFALDSDGGLWTWGFKVFTGDGTYTPTTGFATAMTLPVLNAGASIKMIGTTNFNYANSFGKASYYALSTDGNLYSMGSNHHRQLGTWDTATHMSWTQPTYTAGGAVMDNIKWISPQEHYTDVNTDFGEGSASINVLTNDGVLYNWGHNHRGMLGRDSIAGNIYDPAVPTNTNTSTAAYAVSATDVWQGVETGGHTTMAVLQCETQLMYSGHRINGSMGDGDPVTKDQFYFTKENTPEISVCASEAATVFASTEDVCNGETVTLTASPSGGTFTVLSGTATIDGTNAFIAGAGNDPIIIRYTSPASCNAVTKDLTFYRKDYGNLSATWPVASATIFGADKTWLGMDEATAECTTSSTDAADGFSIAAATGAGTETDKFILSRGVTYSATVTVNGSGVSKPVYWGIWYDVNGDGDFTDAEDIFLSGDDAHGSPVSVPVSFTVPTTGTAAGATSGAIRIAATSDPVVFSQATNGTVQLRNGEIEDFFVEYDEPLPVTLSIFEAKKAGTTSLLNWETASEKNSAVFIIERSADAISFSKIGEVKATGNSTEVVKYNFTDKQPQSGRNYYRLKMQDIDGAVEYSAVRMLSFGLSASDIAVLPNPAKENVTLTGLQGGEAIYVYDATGRLVKTSTATSATVNMSLVELNEGMYYIKIQDAAGNRVTKKLLKTN